MKPLKEFMNTPTEFQAFHRGLRAGAITIDPRTKLKRIREKFDAPNWEKREAHYFFLGVVIATIGQALLVYLGAKVSGLPKLL